MAQLSTTASSSSFHGCNSHVAQGSCCPSAAPTRLSLQSTIQTLRLQATRHPLHLRHSPSHDVLSHLPKYLKRAPKTLRTISWISSLPSLTNACQRPPYQCTAPSHRRTTLLPRGGTSAESYFKLPPLWHRRSNPHHPKRLLVMATWPCCQRELLIELLTKTFSNLGLHKCLSCSALAPMRVSLRVNSTPPCAFTNTTCALASC